MKYALGDTQGNIVAFYDDTLNPLIPPGGVPITDVQWQDCLENPGKWLVQDNQLVLAPPIPDSVLLQRAKSARAVYLSIKFDQLLVAPVSYTTLAGDQHLFNSTDEEIARLQNAIDNGTRPVWLSATNEIVSPFSFDDAPALLDVILTARGNHPTHQGLLTLIEQVQNAATVEAVNLIDF